jgi:hypothetical protein
MLLILLLFAMSAAELCNNQCSGGEGDWCGERREENGTVRRCAEQTRWDCYRTNYIILLLLHLSSGWLL